jgi:hypothetical protein
MSVLYGGGLVAALGFCGLGLGYAVNAINTPAPTPAQIRIQEKAQALHLSQEQQQAQIDALNAKLDSEWHFDRASTWLRLLEIGGLATLTVCIPAGALGGTAWLIHHSRKELPTKDLRVGLRGMDYEQKRTILRDRLHVAAIAAGNPALPKNLAHLHTVQSPRITGGQANLVEEPPLTISRIPDVPSVGRLIQSGEIGGNRPLLFGYAETGGVRHEGREHFSIAIVGKPDFGKSNSGGVVFAQHVLLGADGVLCDPHAGNPRSLATRLAPLEEAGVFLLPTADSPKEILSAVRTVHGELKAREGRQKRWRKDNGPSVPAPKDRLLSLVIDELPELLRGELADDLPPLLADIIQAGPKMNIVALLMGQQWATIAVGGAMVRNSIPAAILHNCRSVDARAASGLRSANIPDGVEMLGQGEAFMVAPGVSAVRITVPRLEADDLVEVARLAAAQRGNGLGNGADLRFLRQGTAVGTTIMEAAVPARISAGSEYESAVPRAGARARVGDERADKIIAMLTAGKKIPAIAKALYQPTVGTERLVGNAYYAATDEVTEVIAEWVAAKAQTETQPPLTILPMDDEAKESD